VAELVHQGCLLHQRQQQRQEQSQKISTHAPRLSNH
jgi:hypothetical protein